MSEIVDLDQPEERVPVPPRLRAVAGGACGVAALELRGWLQTGRWRAQVAAWFLALVVVALGLRQFALHRFAGRTFVVDGFSPGAIMFAGLSAVVVLAVPLVVPAGAATPEGLSRSAWETILGRFVARWGVAVVFLVVSLPLDAWAFAEGGVGVGRWGAVTLAQALLLGLPAALSTALPGGLARALTLGLTLGAVLVFTLATTFVQRRVHVGTAQGHAYYETVTDSARIWWLLAPSPLVIMVDTSPEPADVRVGSHGVDGIFYGSPVERPVAAGSLRSVVDSPDPLGTGREVTRGLRSSVDAQGDLTGGGGLVWAWGLGFDGVVGVTALVVAQRRLRR